MRPAIDFFWLYGSWVPGSIPVSPVIGRVYLDTPKAVAGALTIDKTKALAGALRIDTAKAIAAKVTLTT